MEEVRSYWQVASIAHFCDIFGKPLKLPSFEPEELEQAFILDIPPPPQAANNHTSNDHDNQHQPNKSDLDEETCYNHNGIDDCLIPENQNNCNDDIKDQHDEDPDYSPPLHQTRNSTNQFKEPQPISKKPEEQQTRQELHLLVRLAIALLKPHFNCKISHNNWENYLHRIIDTNWVGLENHPSPFEVPLVSQDGVVLTKNLAFNDLPLCDKIDIFYALCDYRLWCEDAPDSIKDFTLEELRLESIGKDSQGYEYWYFSGTRLFRENKELFQDILLRKTRIKELEYKLIELEKTRIAKDQEDKRKAELEKAKQLAAEARLAAKKQQEMKASSNSRAKKQPTPVLQPRTGLRERRSSAASNALNSPQQVSSAPTTRSRLSKASSTPTPSEIPDASRQQSNSTRNQPSRNSKAKDIRYDSKKAPLPSKKSPEEECREELETIQISQSDRNEAWCIACESLEEWEAFAIKFEKTKSTNEKYLSAHVNEYILPHIRAIYNKRANEAKRKEKELLLSLTSRRVSTRIISKKAQEEEEERQAQIHEAEMRHKKADAEARLRAELEREMKVRQNRLFTNDLPEMEQDGEDNSTNTRYNLRQQQNFPDSDEFDGIIHPDKLSEFYEALELIVDSVRTSKHAWPFVDPVPQTVTGYYDMIKEPMDLRKLRTKIEFRGYKCLAELEKDFQLLVNNCERFNGPKNVYTKMVYKLWKSFRKNVRLYLQRDLSMNEYETFVYPPPKPEPKVEPEPEPESEPEPEPDLKHGPESENAMLTKIEPIPISSGADIMDMELETTHAGPLIVSEEKTVITNNILPVNYPLPPASPELKAPTPEPIIADSPPPMKMTKLENHCEDIIIDSYDVPCPDETFFLWPQDNNVVKPAK